MKTGKAIHELAAEITRQAESKVDYIADTTALSMWVPESNKGKPEICLNKTDTFGITGLAHGQIAEHTRIPKPYYDRMLSEAPDLLATNVERWFKKYPAKRLVRILDSNMRAFLSNGYRPLDNFDFAHALLPVIAKRNLEIMSCELTEKRLYIKAVDTQLFRDVPVGYRMGDGTHRIFDTCAPAIILSNSEVGFGRLVLDTGVYTKACTNLALFANGGMKRTHIGARHKIAEAAGIENIDHLLSDKTKQKTDEALWAQARDILAAAFDTGRIGERLERIEAAANNKITGKVERVIDAAADKFSLNEIERDNVLKYLIEGGSLTQYGLQAAVTRSAQDAIDYDRATDLEYLGGRILELPRHDWQVLAEAA